MIREQPNAAARAKELSLHSSPSPSRRRLRKVYALLVEGGEEDEEIAPKPDFPLIAGHTCCRLGVHFNDVVTITEAFGEKPRVGYFEDFDDKWGAAIIWPDGSRTWYPWDRWDTEAIRLGSAFLARACVF